MWNENGSLSVIDRIKNLVKGPCGEYIALEKLESIYKNSIFVQNICVYADNDVPKIVAIVQVPPEILDEKHVKNPMKDKQFQKEMIADLEKVGYKNGLKKYEIVTDVIPVTEEWSPDNGMLTAAMKLNRRSIYKTFDQEMQEILQN